MQGICFRITCIGSLWGCVSHPPSPSLNGQEGGPTLKIDERIIAPEVIATVTTSAQPAFSFHSSTEHIRETLPLPTQNIWFSI